MTDVPPVSPRRAAQPAPRAQCYYSAVCGTTVLHVPTLLLAPRLLQPPPTVHVEDQVLLTLQRHGLKSLLGIMELVARVEHDEAAPYVARMGHTVMANFSMTVRDRRGRFVTVFFCIRLDGEDRRITVCGIEPFEPTPPRRGPRLATGAIIEFMVANDDPDPRMASRKLGDAGFAAARAFLLGALGMGLTLPRHVAGPSGDPDPSPVGGRSWVSLRRILGRVLGRPATSPINGDGRLGRDGLVAAVFDLDAAEVCAIGVDLAGGGVPAGVPGDEATRSDGYRAHGGAGAGSHIMGASGTPLIDGEDLAANFAERLARDAGGVDTGGTIDTAAGAANDALPGHPAGAHRRHGVSALAVPLVASVLLALAVPMVLGGGVDLARRLQGTEPPLRNDCGMPTSWAGVHGVACMTPVAHVTGREGVAAADTPAGPQVVVLTSAADHAPGNADDLAGGGDPTAATGGVGALDAPGATLNDGGVTAVAEPSDLGRGDVTAVAEAAILRHGGVMVVVVAPTSASLGEVTPLGRFGDVLSRTAQLRRTSGAGATSIDFGLRRLQQSTSMSTLILIDTAFEGAEPWALPLRADQ